MRDAGASFGLVLGLGLCGTGLACSLYTFIVDPLRAVAASGVAYLPPIVALLIGALWVGEPVRPLDLLVMAAILVEVGALQSSRVALPVKRCPAQ